MNGCGATNGSATARQPITNYMKTRKFKTLRGWLEFIARRQKRTDGGVYETLEYFFRDEWHFHYFTDYGTLKERWHNERISVPWEQKLPIAQEIVDFHWRSRTKAERQRIATALAKGEGDLSYLASFCLSLRKENGKWQYHYCTSGISGPNQDYCKRKYLRSL